MTTLEAITPVIVESCTGRTLDNVDVRTLGSFCLFGEDALPPDVLNDKRRSIAIGSYDLPHEEALDALYPKSQEACATRSLVEEFGVRAKMGNAPFAVLAVEGSDPRSVVARRLEARLFAKEFGTHPSEHELLLNKYHDSSLLLTMFDMSLETPVPAGVIRIIRPSSVGLKTINTLSSNEMSGEKTVNPWHDDLAEKIEGYATATPHKRKMMLYRFFNIKPSETWDVATMAVSDEYRHKGRGLSPAWALHAATVTVAPGMGIKSLISLQDESPLQQQQDRFGRPWTDKLTPDEDGNLGKYAFKPVIFEGGIEPVVPSCLPNIFVARRRMEHSDSDLDRFVAAMLRNPDVYGDTFKLPHDLQPELFL